MASRIPTSQVLDHPFRQALFDRIRATPGVAFLELFHHFKQDANFADGLGYGSLMYHLQQLERARHITTRKSGRFRRHYENGGPWNGDTTALAVLQTRTAQRIAGIVLAEPGLHQQAVWARYRETAPVTRQAVAYQLRRLAAHGLVVSTRSEGFLRHYGTETLQRLMEFVGAREPSTILEAAMVPAGVEPSTLTVEDAAVAIP